MTDNISADGDFLARGYASRNIFTPEDFTDEHKQIADSTERFVESEISRSTSFAENLRTAPNWG